MRVGRGSWFVYKRCLVYMFRVGNVDGFWDRGFSFFGGNWLKLLIRFRLGREVGKVRRV